MPMPVQITGLPAHPFLPPGLLVTVPPPELLTVTDVWSVRAEADTVRHTAAPTTSRMPQRRLTRTPAEYRRALFRRLPLFEIRRCSHNVPPCAPSSSWSSR